MHHRHRHLQRRPLTLGSDTRSWSIAFFGRSHIPHIQAKIMTLPATRQHTIALSAADTDWQRHSRCRDADPSLFFGPENEAGHERALRETEAKRVCEECPVLLRCRKHALAHFEQHGIWGGLTEDERTRHRRPLWRVL